MNQCERVLAYIKGHGSITTLEAMRNIGVARLGARICELSAEPITALAIAVAMGACAGRVYEQMFVKQKKAARPSKGTPHKNNPIQIIPHQGGICQ